MTKNSLAENSLAEVRRIRETIGQTCDFDLGQLAERYLRLDRELAGPIVREVPREAPTAPARSVLILPYVVSATGRKVNDDIAAEIRRMKDDFARRFNYDIRAMVAEMMRLDQLTHLPVVREIALESDIHYAPNAPKSVSLENNMTEK
jgi:hypothetical protein